MNSLTLKSKFTFLADKHSLFVTFCRPFDPVTRQVTLYVDEDNNSTFETGTIEHPFSNLAFAFIEPFNFHNQITLAEISYKIYLSSGEHVVYSGRLPLFVNQLDLTVQASTSATLKFHSVEHDELETYYYKLFDHSLSQLNYRYVNPIDPQLSEIFHKLYPATHMTIYNSNITLLDIDIKQVNPLQC